MRTRRAIAQWQKPFEVVALGRQSHPGEQKKPK